MEQFFLLSLLRSFEGSTAEVGEINSLACLDLSLKRKSRLARKGLWLVANI